MADDTTSIDEHDDPELLPGTAAERADEEEHGLSAISSEELPMLPGEVKAHSSPFQYVMIAVVLCVLTAVEVGLYYIEDDLPTALYVGMLLALALAKFIMVASLYMHLRQGQAVVPAVLHHRGHRSRDPVHDRPHHLPRLGLT